MTFVEATKIIQDQNPLLYVRSCTEFKDFFLFSLAPLTISRDEEYVTGRIFPIVNKSDGSISEYDILSDLDVFENAELVYEC